MPNLVDLVIVIAVIAGIFRGIKNGFVRQVFSLGGFIGGLYLGAVVAPYASKLAGTAAMRELIVIIIVIAGAVAIGSISEYVGEQVAKAITKLRGEPLDAAAGGGFGAILVLLTVWLVAGMLIGSPFIRLNQELAGSQIIRQLDTKLPAAPQEISRLERLLDPNGFPEVFAGLEPTPTGPVTVATQAQVNSAVAADRASTVKIQGQGCGGLVSGSGFIVAPGYVMTNAHVVAGIRSPEVIDTNGRHLAQVVQFDPNLDIAVLRTTGLAGSPLAFVTNDQSSGSPTVVLGYPGGGDFTAVAAGVISERFATGRNIYNEGLTDREIYVLQTIVLPGNSGGPLVLPDGTVAGVVFARSETNTNVGYALVASQVKSKVAAAQATRSAVSTGSCAAD